MTLPLKLAGSWLRSLRRQQNLESLCVLFSLDAASLQTRQICCHYLNVLYAVSPLNLCKPTKLRPSTQRAGQCGQAQNAQSKPMTDQTMQNVDEVSFSGNISIYGLRGYSAYCEAVEVMLDFTKTLPLFSNLILVILVLSLHWKWILVQKLVMHNQFCGANNVPTASVLNSVSFAQVSKDF